MNKSDKLGGGLVDVYGNPIRQEGSAKSNAHTEVPLAYVDGNTFGKWRQNLNSSPYSKNGTIRRAIDIVAQNLAQLPFNIYKDGEKLPFRTPRMGDVDLNALLEMPNENTSAYKFKLVHWSYFMLYDKVYWLLNKNPYGIIKEFYVLNPNMLKAHKDNNGVVKEYTYGKLKFGVDEVIEFSGFSPNSLSGSGGSSIIDTIRTEYETENAASSYGKKFFENGTRINGVITVDKDVPVTIEDMNKVLGQWMQAHQGSNNAYKVGALLNGMSYEERGMTMRDAEFIEGRKEIKERIIEVYGIPKSVFGLVDKIDRATADTQMRQFWQVTLKPLAIMMQEDINTLLARKHYPGYTVKYDFTVVEELKKDLNETADAARKYFELGYTRDEVNSRFKLGMEETTDNGDVRYIPTSLISVDESIEMEVLEDSDKSKHQRCIAAKQSVDEVTVDKSSEPFRNRFLKDQRNQEKKFHSKIKRFLFEYRQEALEVLNNSKSTIDIILLTNALNNLKNSQDIKISKMTEPLYLAATKVAAQGTFDLLGIDDVAKGNSALANAAANRITGVNKTINDKILKEIKEGIDAGENIDKLSKRVKNVYNFTSSRSRVIARTESSRIMNASTLATYKDRGVKKKKWLDAGDSKVRPEHKDNAGQGAIPVEEAFSSGELYPNAVNCRCCIAPAIVV